MSIDKTKKIRVYNKSLSSVSYSHEGLRVRRYWDRPDTALLIPFEELEEVLFNGGTRQLFADYLFVADAAVRQELGLEDEDNAYENMSREQFITILNGDMAGIEDMCENASPGILSLIADLAVEIRLDSLQKIDYLSRATGRDLQSVLKIKEENNEAPAIKASTKDIKKTPSVPVGGVAKKQIASSK